MADGNGGLLGAWAAWVGAVEQTYPQRLADGRLVLHGGDCIATLDLLPENSVDAIVTDPPYHLTSVVKRFGAEGAAAAQFGTDGLYARQSRGFMGKQWDGGDIAFRPELWARVLRVLKPGGHVAAFSGTRTYHRMACAIEDAGFEIRDQLAWVYGSGFPKSLDVSKALTKRTDPKLLLEIKLWLSEHFAACGKTKAAINEAVGFTASDYLKTEPGNDAGGRATWHLLLPYGAKWKALQAVLQFDNRYDAEIDRLGVIMAQREQPKATKDVYGKFSGVVSEYELTDEARQWAGWGTALKPAWEPICFARKPLIGTVAETVLRHGTGALNVDACRVEGAFVSGWSKSGSKESENGSMSGKNYARDPKPDAAGRWPANLVHDGSDEVVSCFPDTKGGAFPVSRGAGGIGNNGHKGQDGLTASRTDAGSAARFFYAAKASAKDRAGSKHPTVKPVSLMRWLCRLITPPGGVVLDPFAGSGTTGQAAHEEGFSAILCERETEYLDDIRERVRRMGGA